MRVYQFRHSGKTSKVLIVYCYLHDATCDSGRARTCDPLVKSQLLCQLSYGVVPFGAEYGITAYARMQNRF